jgi:hypothetical protein
MTKVHYALDLSFPEILVRHLEVMPQYLFGLEEVSMLKAAPHFAVDLCLMVQPRSPTGIHRISLEAVGVCAHVWLEILENVLPAVNVSQLSGFGYNTIPPVFAFRVSHWEYDPAVRACEL